MISKIRMWPFILLFFLIVGLAIILLNWIRNTARNRYENVILIVVDTLRQDKLGCYGNPESLTPNMDFLSRRGTQFSDCCAHSSWTLPAVASLLTATLPHRHKAGGSYDALSGLDDQVRTLAECFREGGYETACIINVDFLTRTFGMTRGFQQVNHKIFPNNIQIRDAAETTHTAIDWLKTRTKGPFFLFIHYFDPHLIYNPPDLFRKMWADSRDVKSNRWQFGTRTQIIDRRNGLLPLDSETVSRAEKLYNGEVAFTDHEIGKLLGYLTASGAARDTLLVLTSDHGEEFFDHGDIDHGHTLYNELVHVPLIFSYRQPADNANTIIRQTVQHLDVGPTMCELMGIAEGIGLKAHSLVPLLRGEEMTTGPVIFYGSFWGPPLTGCSSGNIKLIRSEQKGEQCYDLARDPAENNNIADLDFPGRQECMRVLESIFQPHSESSEEQTSVPVTLDDQTRQRLEHLGYLEE